MTLPTFLLARIDVKARRAEAMVTDSSELLAECEAVRRIVELHAVECYVGDGPDGDDEYVCECSRGESGSHPDDVKCPTLAILASIYADHPDYREEWKP
jgi:hypothetical protein